MANADVTEARKTPQLVWLNRVKGIAMIWLFLNHLAEQLFGGPAVANPSHAWGTLRERVEQLAPLPGQGLAGLFANLLRYVGWGGDMAGVQLFILVSGFGLAWSLVNSPAGEALKASSFYRRRLSRIYPEWLTIHLLLGVLGTVSLLNDAPSVFQRTFWLSILGIRLLPSTMYAFSPAWWFFGLLVQLYIVFPLLWTGVRRLGPWRLFLVASLTGCVFRAIGLLVFDDYLDLWSRGAVFVTQLPTFSLGIAMAVWFHDRPPSTSAKSWGLFPVGLVLFLAGNALGLFLLGMAVAPFIVGVGSFAALWPLIARPNLGLLGLDRPVTWVGRHSLSFFLVHHVIILKLGPAHYDFVAPLFWARIGACVLVTVLGTLLIERVALAGEKAIKSLHGRLGGPRTCLALGSTGMLMLTTLVACELCVRKFDPQEVMGWGELPSLAPSNLFDWQLKPSKTTRLRWGSYDYTVQSNALGFPGPTYPRERIPGSFRILTTGDAFTSAEGVNSEQAWPRVLERRLAQKSTDVKWEVLNFAVTGYGPTQDAAVLEHFVPQFRPNLVILEMYINDFDDEVAGHSLRDTIGFSSEVAQSSLKGIIELTHLSSWVRGRVDMLKQRLSGKLSPQAISSSGLMWLARDARSNQPEVQQRMKARLAGIRQTVESYGAALLVIIVPGAIQVCAAQSLPYMAHARVDESVLDSEGPQRVIKAICQELGIESVDLRPVVTSDHCLYQPENWHWLPEAHERVAAHLADTIGPSAKTLAHP